MGKRGVSNPQLLLFWALGQEVGRNRISRTNSNESAHVPQSGQCALYSDSVNRIEMDRQNSRCRFFYVSPPLHLKPRSKIHSLNQMKHLNLIALYVSIVSIRNPRSAIHDPFSVQSNEAFESYRFLCIDCLNPQSAIPLVPNQMKDLNPIAFED